MENNLKEIRQQNNLSQEQLATLVQVSRQTILSIEKCHYFPTAILAIKIATVLSVTVEALFTLTTTDWA